MTTKTITIDEKAIYDSILSKMEDEYDLAYISYDDSVPSEILQKCLDRKSNQPLFEEDYWYDQICESARHILGELLDAEDLTHDQKALFRTTEEYDELYDTIRERDSSSPERDACRQTNAHVYLRFHSNYDCWLPLWETGGLHAEGTALGGIMAALSLNPRKVRDAACKKGITVHGAWRNIPSREGKEIVEYDKFIRVLCETPNYGNWSFFGTVCAEDLLDNSFDIEDMTIPSGTTCAMFNWWNGGGSLDFCRTIRPVTVKELRRRLARYSDDLKPVIDDRKSEHGYTPRDVYGDWLSNDAMLVN